MAEVPYISDLILHNILSRLPSKPLLQSRTVSPHWNRLVTEPYFMTSRAHRTIILPGETGFRLIDVTVPMDDIPRSILNLHHPIENHDRLPVSVSVVGTCSGIVLLSYTTFEQYIDPDRRNLNMMLYNPLIRSSMILPKPPQHCSRFRRVYGLGYGLNPDDFKIVVIRGDDNGYYDTCDVFGVKGGSWTRSRVIVDQPLYFADVSGTFLNGSLYWVADDTINHETVIVALDIDDGDDKSFSFIHLPDQSSHFNPLLGTYNGRLCTINTNLFMVGRFDIWVMNENSTWSKAHSFTFGMENYTLKNEVYPIRILDNGRILMRTWDDQLLIYEMSTASYELLDITLSENEKWSIHCVEYVESFVSLSDV